ncbi:MAG: hypothetical protein PHG00_08495 [Methylococcales bacterium]|nr:hypothetical protein [Methylococcales bacterium]
MTNHKITKQHTTIATLLLISIGILFTCNTFAGGGDDQHFMHSKPSAVHKIGESYGGGIVFYVYDGGQHGLIAATEDQNVNGDYNIRWAASFTNTGARADGVGAGKANTALIIANQASVDGSPFAASVCNEYSVTDADGVTYGDWYLPSKYELNLLYLQKDVVGGFQNNLYWGSRDYTEETASTQIIRLDTPSPSVFEGEQGAMSKNGTARVRAIRAF